MSSYAGFPFGSSGGAGATGPQGPAGDGSLSTTQGTQSVSNNTLTSLSGLSLVASSAYDVQVFDVANGLVAECDFITDAGAAVVTASFQVQLGCNLQDTDDAAQFANGYPGMGLNSGAIAFKQLSGSSMSIRWVARRGAAS